MSFCSKKISKDMDSSDLCQAEEAVQTFLDYLVDPMLPAKSSARDTPSLPEQQSISKQVHAVVLLYNYYHRKQHQQLEFLGFESFCKLVVVLKPPLLAHMKLMQGSNDTELDNLEKQISITEKTVMDACDISKSLDISKDVPSSKGWPISKVTVFLVDSRKENCLLLFGSITQGVWSVIEKDPDVPSGTNQSSEGMMEAKHINKKKRITKRPLSDPSADEAGFQQLAFSAVKEVAGINQTDLTILESHVVYSLSKEKTASRFYIMRCMQSINEDVIQVPIKDVIDSLKGPLVKKSSCSWTVTPVVEYFHVLPYAGIVSNWLSRDVFSNSVQDLRVGLGNVTVNSSQGTEEPCGTEINNKREISHANGSTVVGFGNKTSSSNTESLKQEENNGCCMNGLSTDFSGPHNMDEDDSCVVWLQNKEKSRNIPDTDQFDLHQRGMIPSMESDQTTSTSGFAVKAEMVDSSMMTCITGCGGEKVAPENMICNNKSSDQDGMTIGDRALVTYQSNSKHLDKLQTTIASKDNILSQTALRVLLTKRDKLVHQQRSIEDEIAKCDKNMQTILNGGEDDLALKIDSIIEGCNDVCLRSATYTRDRTNQHFEDQGLPHYLKRKRLSEAILNIQNACQELDSICNENNWVLPTYHVSPSDGGFQANVTVKGMDFECSCGGDCGANPHKARESAASQLLIKLKSMASLAQ
ncbi:hypothetical protein L1049_016654 [Liquidambar formosana]|uniref:DRBM domain-containing protein n=1 Tax=Liquidambar formosana TaxID=63359 RepID=A0AAP0X7N5_LIQFO